MTNETSTTEGKRSWFARHKIMTGILGAFLFLFLIGVVFGDDDPASEPAASPRDTGSTKAVETEEEKASDVTAKPKPTPKEPEPEPEPQLTVSQENALESAESYLETGAFSKKGLLGQLTSEYGEGFPKKDAFFAVNHVKVDWKAEAVESAKSYLDTGSFSRQGLIDQLTSEYGEQFTMQEAVYAVNKVGL